MVKCIVIGCKNYYGGKNKKMRFKPFPKKNDSEYSKWFKLCGESNIISDEKVICEDHFPRAVFHTKTCIVNNLRKCKCNFKVSNTVLPTLFLPTEDQIHLYQEKGISYSPKKLPAHMTERRSEGRSKRVIENPEIKEKTLKNVKKTSVKNEESTPRKRGRPKISQKSEIEGCVPKKNTQQEQVIELTKDRDRPKRIENSRNERSSLKQSTQLQGTKLSASPAKNKSVAANNTDKKSLDESEEILKRLHDITVQKATLCESSKSESAPKSTGVKRKSTALNKETTLKTKQMKISDKAPINNSDPRVNQLLNQMIPILPKDPNNPPKSNLGSPNMSLIQPKLSRTSPKNKNYSTIMTNTVNVCTPKSKTLHRKQARKKSEKVSQKYTALNPVPIKPKPSDHDKTLGNKIDYVRSTLESRNCNQFYINELSEVTISKVTTTEEKDEEDWEEGDMEIFSGDENEDAVMDYEPREYSLHQLCRICGECKEDNIQIFSNEGKEHNLLDKIVLCLPVEIKPEDELPHIMCLECKTALDASFELARKSFKADQNLRRILEQNKLFESVTILDDPLDDTSDFPETLEIISSDDEDTTLPNPPLPNKNPSKSPEENEPHKFKSIIFPMPATSKNDKVYYCASCNKRFEHIVLASLHCQTVHNLHMCDTCCGVFCNRTELEEHLTTVCLKNKAIKKSDTLIVTSNDPNYKFTCSLCTIGLNTIENATEHGFKEHCLHMCPICFCMFPELKNMETHLQNGHPITKTLKNVHLNPTQCNSKENKPKHVCNKCWKIFFKTDLYEKHLKTNCKDSVVHLKEKLNKCTDLTIRQYHNQKVRVGYQIECKLCQTNIIVQGDRTVLQSHYKVKHNLYFCRICMNYYNNSTREMQKHVTKNHRKIKENDKYHCEFCGRAYVFKSNFKEHLMKLHLNIKPHYKCKICGNVSKCRSAFNSHKKHHGNVKEKPKKLMKKVSDCVLCIAKVPNIYIKNHYKKVHKQYLCTYCKNKCFHNRTLLVYHLRTVHKKKKTKKYTCDYCTSNYKLKSQLKSHIMEEHLYLDKKYRCGPCYRKFHLRIELLKHLKIIHGFKTIYECKICNYFTLENNLQEHINSKHEFHCKTCCIDFDNITDLGQHYRLYHTTEWIFVCNMCKAEFNLESAVILHCDYHRKRDKLKFRQRNLYSKVTPFKCNECNVYYVSSVLLKKHMDSSHRAKVEKKELEYEVLALNDGTVCIENAEEIIFKEQCEYCDKVFVNEEALNEHLITIHDL